MKTTISQIAKNKPRKAAKSRAYTLARGANTGRSLDPKLATSLAKIEANMVNAKGIELALLVARRDAILEKLGRIRRD